MTVNIYCTVKSKHSRVPLVKSVPRSEKATVFFKEFRAQIRDQYGLVGEVTVHRATKDNTTDDLIRGTEIIETEFTLTENEHILVIYDEEIQVVPGGGATGADVVSPCGRATAEGGRGTGGSIDADDNAEGGTGFGGDGSGEGVQGQAGLGFGAKVVALDSGKGAKGGRGYGGELKRKGPDGPSK